MRIIKRFGPLFLMAAVIGCQPVIFRFGGRKVSSLSREESAFIRMERELKRAMRRNPSDPVAPTSLASIYHQRGDFQTAEEYFNKALEISPRHYAARAGLAVMYMEWGKPDKALPQAMAAARDNPGDAGAFLLLSRVHNELGDAAAARSALNKGLVVDPESAALLLEHARLCLNSKDSAAALEYCRKAVAAAPLNPNARADLAGILSSLGKHKQALAEAQAAVDLDGAGEAHWEILGVVAEAAGRDQLAVEAYNRSLQIYNDRFSAHKHLAVLLERLGREPEALEHYIAAASRAPRQKQILQKAAALARKLGRKQDEISARLKLTRAFPSDAGLLADAGLALERAGAEEQAIKIWKQVVELDGENVRAHAALARLWKKLGKAGRATLHFRALLQKNPADMVALEGMAALCVEEGKFEEARDYYRRLVQADPDRAGSRAMLGLVYSELGDNNSAAAELNKAVEIDPGLAVAHRELANVLRKTGQTDSAVKHAEKATELAPGDMKSWVALAMVYKAAGRKQQAAQAYIRAASEAGNSNPELYWNAADAAEAAGDPAAAVQLFRKLAEVPGQKAAAARQLGRLAGSSGDHGAELYWLRMVLHVTDQQVPWRERVAERVEELYQDRAAVEGALKLYWRDLQTDARNPLALGGMGSLEYVRGEYQNSARSFEKLLAVQPRSREAARALVTVYARLGRSNRALSAALRLVAVAPESADARFVLARAYMEVGDRQRQELALRSALKLDEKHAAAHNALGVILARTDRIAEGRGHFERAAELQPRATWPVHNLAVLTGRDLEDPEMGARYRLREKTMVSEGAQPVPADKNDAYWMYYPEDRW